MSTSDPGALRAKAEAWAAADPDPAMAAAVRTLLQSGDDAAIEELFDGRIAFGTAGLRAPLGPGPRRMNEAVVRQTSLAVVRWLHQQGVAAPSFVVGHDARHGSRQMAEAAAATIVAAGGVARLGTEPRPTPVFAHECRRLHADAAIVITASHNPPADNGYKLYLGDGAQLHPPYDAEIAVLIDEIAGDGVIPAGAPLDQVERLGEATDSAYVAIAASACPSGADTSGLRVVHTSLHGVAHTTLIAAFEKAGYPAPNTVEAQRYPDPDFPTVAFPNPEEPGALDLALALATETKADLVLANDPDGDRLGVAVPDPHQPSGYRVLTGDEIGALLAEHILANGTGDDRLVVNTVVSSRLLARIAETHGVHHETTLTGFKWIMRPAVEATDRRFVFGYEEALGYAVEPSVRDKDGISAAICFTDMVASLAADERTILDELDRLARTHGLHRTTQLTKRFDGSDGVAQQRATMSAVRAQPPATIGGVEVSAVLDLLQEQAIDRHSDLITWSLGAAGERGSVSIRPSGTEPKVKVYIEVVEPVLEDGSVDEAESKGDATIANIAADLASFGFA